MATQITTLTDRHWLGSRIAKAKATGPFAEPVELTPRLAKMLLEANPTNRPVTLSRVRTYARDIKEGRWAFNGETIIMSSEGLVNDGQHRCHAVIEAGQSITTMIAFGLDRETRKTTDIGSSKNAGSFAGMDGIPHASTVAGVARLVLAFNEDRNLNKTNRITNTRVYEFIQDNRDELVAIARRCHALQGHLRGMVAGSVYGFCRFICQQHDKDAADEFYEKLATGEMLAINDPAYVARQRMMNMGKAVRQAKAEIILHGWNAYRKGAKRTFTKVYGQLPPISK